MYQHKSNCDFGSQLWILYVKNIISQGFFVLFLCFLCCFKSQQSPFLYLVMSCSLISLALHYWCWCPWLSHSKIKQFQQFKLLFLSIVHLSLCELNNSHITDHQSQRKHPTTPPFLQICYVWRNVIRLHIVLLVLTTSVYLCCFASLSCSFSFLVCCCEWRRQAASDQDTAYLKHNTDI